MKSIVTAAAVGLAVLAVAAPSPVAAPEASPTLQQFNALKGQVNTLKKRVTTAENRVGDLEGEMDCIDDAAIPVTQYGTATEGYVYVVQGQPNAFVTTALDITETGSTPMAWLVEVNADCVTDGDTARFAPRGDAGGAERAVLRPRR
jgi:hypothetical protein